MVKEFGLTRLHKPIEPPLARCSLPSLALVSGATDMVVTTDVLVTNATTNSLMSGAWNVVWFIGCLD